MDTEDCGYSKVLPPGIAGTQRSSRSCCSQPEIKIHLKCLELFKVSS